ncbi:hypothetical protein K466DRAFT_23357 [Polyporus arcularius HHB13444]|uniref:Uncharacterized protein n=1 Tax=Polyporus arcularius HHB13444 TaxID=1314778 RepID=A0A5C3Q6Q2_9APHY|nr:hypothetical protein K466DRAFT_23357 [Polyporus arcularius HHB13444]
MVVALGHVLRRKNCKALASQASIFLAFLCSISFQRLQGVGEYRARTYSCDAPQIIASSDVLRSPRMKLLDRGPTVMMRVHTLSTRSTALRDGYLRYRTRLSRPLDCTTCIGYSPAALPVSCRPSTLHAKFPRSGMTF